MNRVLLITLAALSGAAISQAVDIVKLPAGMMNETNGWVGGVVPGNADVGVFDSTSVTNGAGVTFYSDSTPQCYFGGLRVADVTGPITISQGNSTFTVYASGLDMSAAAADMTFADGTYRLNPGSDFNIGPGRTFTVNNVSQQANPYTINVYGGGTLAVNGTLSGARIALNVYDGAKLAGTGTYIPGAQSGVIGITMGVGTFIVPGNNGVGTLTINGANSAGLSMLDGSGLRFELGTGGTYALPSDDSDQIALVNMYSNKVAFGGTTTIDFSNTGSEGVFKLFDTDFGTNTWSGLGLDVDGVTIIAGLTFSNLASGLPAPQKLILGDGTTGEDGDIYLVVGDILPPYNPLDVSWAVGDGVWDVDSTANWDDGFGPAVYYERGGIGDNVTFDDTASGTSPITITLDTNVYPSAVMVDSAKDYTITGTGSINGVDTVLTKTGDGTLTLGITDSGYAAGTLISGGAVIMTNLTTTLGTGAVTMENDSLLVVPLGDQPDSTNLLSSAFANELIVPSGQTGTVWNMPRGTWSGALTGSGTLNLRVNGARAEFQNQWSGFAGQLNVTSRKDTSEFRLRLSYNSGLRLGTAKLYLADGVYMHQTLTPQSGAVGTVHEIGELSGSAGAIIGGSSVGGRYANWTVGALNTDSTFAGMIRDDIDQDNWGGYGAAKLTKVGTGMLTLSGTNTYTGSTEVNAGTLFLSGAIANTNMIVAVNVASNAAIGGGGVIGGDLTLNDGALFAFNVSDTLTVSNSLIFNNTSNSFGVADVVVDDWNSVADGTYTLIAGFTNSVSGIDTSDYDIGGRMAHLQGGSTLQLIVGTGTAPTLSFYVSSGTAYLSWDIPGTYNVLTNGNLANPAGWGEAVHGASSPVAIPLGSENQLFYGLGQ